MNEEFKIPIFLEVLSSSEESLLVLNLKTNQVIKLEAFYADVFKMVKENTNKRNLCLRLNEKYQELTPSQVIDEVYKFEAFINDL